ncbi:hypothetical protein BVY01_00930 [bacterium I07]|nr:hypothetical protein BVY01_00930 [bacterium I07]
MGFPRLKSKYDRLDSKIQRMRDNGDVKGLIRMLRSRYSREDWKYGTMKKSIEALGFVGDERAIKPLAEQIRFYTGKTTAKPQFLPQNAIAKIVERIGKEKALPKLTGIIQHDLKRKNIGAHSTSIISQIGKIGDTRVVEILIDVLNLWKSASDSKAIDETRTARKTAAVALGNIGDKRAIEALEEALTSKNPKPLPGHVTPDGHQIMTDSEYLYVHDPIKKALKQIRKKTD